ncbi:MAG: PhnE/PtxC family ABC transporter permease, partial [Acidimicrobiales bacterium]
WPLVRRFFAAALHPELGGSFLRIVADAALTTLAYATAGTVLSLAIGATGGLLSSQVWWGRHRRLGGWVAARVAIGVPRALHEVVWGLALVNILGLDPLVGVLAIAIPYGAVTAKVFSELLDEAPRSSYDALRTAGAGRLAAVAYSLGPQALPDMVSYAFYRFECSIRAATILGLIGAGGLGFQLSLSFQSLRYGEIWTLLYALVAIGAAAEWWSRSVRRRVTAAGARAVEPGRPPRRDRVLTASVLAVVLAAPLAAWHLGLDPSTLWSPRTRRLAADLAGQVFPPRVTAAALAELARLSVETLQMAVLAIALAGSAAAVVAFLAARRGPLSWACRAVLLACRAVPPPVWALLALFVLFPGPVPGAVALAVYNFGILGRLMAEVVEGLDARPAAALSGLGASGAQAFLYAVVPAALPRFAAYNVYRWEVTIRETVVVGLVGAGGLGRLLTDQLTRFDYPGLSLTLIALIVLTLAADVAGSSFRRALR